MKMFLIIAIILTGFTWSFAQNEQSPIVEKEFDYKNWTLKDVRTSRELELRDLTKGKKLVIAVYFAPWCPNWRHDAPFLERFYEKYKANGLEIVGIGEYDPVDSIKNSLDALKITFPVVYESTDRAEKQKTTHYDYRKMTGDARNWGSPWYVLLDPSALEKKGDTVTKRTRVINGEMIETEGEKFIREKLGLPAEEVKSVADKGKLEVCEPDKKTADLKKP